MLFFVWYKLKKVCIFTKTKTNIMTYKEFYTLATQGIDYKTISREDMQFAFIMFYQQFGESPKKAVESVQLLNTFN